VLYALGYGLNLSLVNMVGSEENPGKEKENKVGKGKKKGRRRDVDRKGGNR